MNRKAIILAACVIIVAGIVFVLASASGGGSGAAPKSTWSASFTMPASNTAAASQTNFSPQFE